MYKEYLHPKNIERIAPAYKDAKDEFGTIMEDQLYYFGKLINLQFHMLRRDGFKFIFVDTDPYKYELVNEMLNDYRHGFIKVNTSGNDSELWGKENNLQFRAIHDYIHCWFDLDFNYVDEVKAFARQFAYSCLPLYKGQFRNLDWLLYGKVLRSEIIYQAAYKEFYKEFHVPVQKIILTDL